jgi:hypothetical protein
LSGWYPNTYANTLGHAQPDPDAISHTDNYTYGNSNAFCYADSDTNT